MRRSVRSFAAAVLSMALMAATGAAVARDHDDRGDREHGGGHGGHSQERGPDRGQERAPPPGWVRGGGERGGDRGGGGRWERGAPEAYGPPPGAYPPPTYYGARRGGRLPPEARGDVVPDYGRYHLRPPPRGYAWVRSGRATMLMDMNTGQVFDVIPD